MHCQKNKLPIQRLPPDDLLCRAQLVSILAALFMCNYIEDIVAEAIELFQYSGHSEGIPPITIFA